MTAEERAAALVKPNEGDYYLDGTADEEDIAAAIRAAEDEALERAAKAIEENPAVESGAIMDGPFFADLVRSLKNSGGTR